MLNKVLELQYSCYKKCGFEYISLRKEKESAEYYAHSFKLGNRNIQFRIAKKTPTKTGWFVSIWKRLQNGITAPYDESDMVDFFVINIINQNKIGQFIFPKNILIENNVFSVNSLGGKRGIRVYSPLDEANNEQAKKTKKWQSKYFIDISEQNTDTEKIKKIFLNN